MIANRAYAYDLEVEKKEVEYLPNKRDFTLIKNTVKKIQSASNIKAKKKSELSLILSVVAMFAMFIILSYRTNLISEKNLELQRLSMKADNVNAVLATTEVKVSRVIDKENIETYAKQQLGMQKPDKSQLVYINSNYETKVESINEGNIVSKVVDKLKDIIGIK